MEPETVQKDGLVIGGTGDAAVADFDTLLAGGKDDVDQVDFAQLLKNATGLVAQTGRPSHLVQRLPENIRQETDQNVGLNPLFGLVPDRADPQIALVDPKCGFGLGQLDVRLPKVFGRPVRYVRSQKITALVERRPLAPCVVFLPRDTRAAVNIFDGDVVKGLPGSSLP